MILRLLRYITFVFLAAAPAAHAQYIFMDTNLDSVCTFVDEPAVGLDTAWVWLDTNHLRDGSTATCSSGEPLTIADYEIILLADSYHSGYHPVSIGRWINKVPEFTDSLDFHVYGAELIYVHLHWSSPGASTHLPPGKYLLGGLEVTMEQPGCNEVKVLSSMNANPIATTSFYSNCPGNQGDHRIYYQDDFGDACGAAGSCVSVDSTTWGRLKKTYR